MAEIDHLDLKAERVNNKKLNLKFKSLLPIACKLLAQLLPILAVSQGDIESSFIVAQSSGQSKGKAARDVRD